MAKRSCGNCPVNMAHQCELDFGLDGYPPCAKAVVENCHSLQQLKAEIAEVRKYIENMRSSKMSSESILNHVDGTLRQLSAV